MIRSVADDGVHTIHPKLLRVAMFVAGAVLELSENGVDGKTCCGWLSSLPTT